MHFRTRKLKQPNYDRNMNKQEQSVTQIIRFGDTYTWTMAKCLRTFGKFWGVFGTCI